MLLLCPDNMKHDPHGREKNLESTIDNLRSGTYSEEEIKKLLEFKDFLFAEGISVERVERYLCTFRVLEDKIGFDLLDASRSDLVQLVGKINQDFKEVSVWTRAEYKKGIKRFFNWFDDSLDLDFIKTHAKKSEQPRTDPADLPQPEDVKCIKKHMEKTRNKAFVSILWQTGGRISEVLNLKWKDITEGEEFAWARFRESKTGERSVPLEDIAALEDWKMDHPDPSEENHVFTRLSSADPISYQGITKYLKRAGEEAGVDCSLRPHDFRKGRATELARKGMSQAQLCEFFGWIQGSDHVEKYVRMAEADLRKAFADVRKNKRRNTGSRVPMQ